MTEKQEDRFWFVMQAAVAVLAIGALMAIIITIVVAIKHL